ncbi:phosphoglycolate phosphatase [Chitinasiproducens palmae]|uniref:phosphoglycolate phosphatase n=1 Tax=Chitinasiproducens palmae TaxID=1770053 RepID=UPI001EEC9BB0|nr:phosphoglycolate phosphatase [Chitinasiproducens palmae]
MATPSPQREIEDALGTARAVLFDLDGTLADTAPDLAAAVNRMLVGRGLPLVPYETLRPVASAGARGLLGAGFGITPEHPDYPALREEFLANYASDLCVETILFPGIDALLAELESRGVRWGIVTNKVESLARPLVEQLGLGTRAACIVGGDTTPFSKPHPAPLLHAAQLLQLPPAQCLYVGDDLRDIQAGRAAGMLTIAAGFGYCGETAPASWGADALVETTDELIALLRELT